MSCAIRLYWSICIDVMLMQTLKMLCKFQQCRRSSEIYMLTLTVLLIIICAKYSTMDSVDSYK